MKKRILSILLAAIMIFSLLPVSAFAVTSSDNLITKAVIENTGGAAGVTVHNVTWNDSENCAVFSGSGSYLEIPSALTTLDTSKGFAVTSEVWIDNDNATWARVFDFNDGTTQKYYTFTAKSDNGNLRTIATIESNSNETKLDVTNSADYRGKWVKLIWVVMADGSMRLYHDVFSEENLIVQCSATNATKALLTDASSFNKCLIGASAWGSGDGYFKGKMRSFSVHSLPAYSITATGSLTKGTLSVPTAAFSGEYVTVTGNMPEATEDSVYRLDSITVTDADGGTVTANKTGVNSFTFQMPNKNVTVSGTVSQHPFYTITDQVTGGTLICESRAADGDPVSLAATAGEGTHLKSFMVTDTSGNSIPVTDNTFVMPASNVTVTAEFEAHSYTVIADGKAFKRVCENANCKLHTAPTATLTLSENGFALFEEKLAWKNAGLEVPAVSYYSGETPLEKKPTTVGSYVIKATFGNKTASYSFTLAPAPSDFTTDENFRMAYNPNEGHSGYDFKGFVNNQWQQISYWWGSYSDGFSAAVFNDPDKKLTVTPAAPEFVANGQAIQMTYTVTNDTTSPVSNFRFYIAADTAIGGNNYDNSTNEVDNDNVVTMKNPLGVSLFALSTTEGGTAVATEYSNAAVSYCDVIYGTDPSTVTQVASAGDSAFVMYFPETTLQPNESAEYNFVIGMGSEETIQDIIRQVRAALGLVDYENEKITGLDPDTTYIFEYKEGETEQRFQIISNEKGEVSLSGKDNNQEDYSFIGRNVKYWVYGSSEEQSQELDIAGRPETPKSSEILPEDEQYAKPEEVLVDTVTETSVKIIPVKGQQYQYSTDSGETWTAVPKSGEITGLTSGSTIKIRTRIAATDKAPASEYSDAVSVTLKTAVKTLEGFSATGYTGIANRQPHSITVTVPDGATVMYSTAPETEYSTNKPEYTEPGEYTVYYRVTKAGCYPAYGSEKVIIKIALADSVTIDYANETIKAKDGYEVSTTSGASFDTGKLTVETAIDFTKTYYIRKAADNNHNASAEETYTPARPAATDLTGTMETIKNKKDASLSGVTSAMEYRMGTETNWTAGTGAVIANPDNLTIYVRTRATAGAFAGETQTIEFTPGDKLLTVTMGEAAQNVAYGSKLTRPSPDPEKADFAFGGWYTDEACTKAWNFAIDTVKDNMTLYPKWIANTVQKAAISGSVKEGDVNVPDATVELYLGTVKVAATVTDTNGVYSFDSVENGTYNIVVTKNNKTRTEMVTVNTAGTFEKEVELPNKAVSSVVEHTGEEIANAKSDISKAVVGGLDEIADDIAKNTPVSGTDKVTIKLTVEPKAESEVTGASDIKALAGSGKKAEFLDLSLWEITTKNNGELKEDIGNKNDVLLTIVIPFDFTGVDVGSVMILRKHGSGNAEKLAASPNEFGEKIEINEAAGTITLYAMKFSDYAVAYSNASHGGGSYTPGHTVTSDLKSVTKVTIDGKVVDKKYYTVSGGNIVLSGEFMKTLTNGKHTVKLYDGLKVATGTITVTGNTNVASAATGDMGIALYAALSVSSILGMGWVGRKKRGE